MRTRLLLLLVALALVVAVVVVASRRGIETTTDGRARARAPNAAPNPVPPNGMPDTAATDEAVESLRRARPPILPDPALTPGAALDVTARDVCVPGYSKRVRNVPASVKRKAYAAYGIARRAPGEYEVDHLISLELGGSNVLANLWPESYRTRPWNARAKDRLENDLHRRVCAGQMTLVAAQREIAGNWVAAYRRRYGAPPAAPTADTPAPEPDR